MTLMMSMRVPQFVPETGGGYRPFASPKVRVTPCPWQYQQLPRLKNMVKILLNLPKIPPKVRGTLSNHIPQCVCQAPGVYQITAPRVNGAINWNVEEASLRRLMLLCSYNHSFKVPSTTNKQKIMRPLYGS